MEQAVPCAIDFVTGFKEGTSVVVVRHKHDFHIYFFHPRLFPFKWVVDHIQLVELLDSLEIEETLSDLECSIGMRS